MDKSKETEPKSNVIEFPTPEGHGWLSRINSMDIKKFTASATLASVLFVVPLLNGVYISMSQDESKASSTNSRGLASFGAVNIPGPEPVNNELLRKIASQTLSGISTVGKKPKHIEKFQFEVLDGNYNVSSDRFDQNKVTKIQLREENMTPKNIQDSETFLAKNKGLWNVDYDSSEKLGDFVMGNKRSEIYSLKGKNDEVVGKATVLTDISGGMISLTISKQ